MGHRDRRHGRRAIALIAAAVLLAAACGDDGSDRGSDQESAAGSWEAEFDSACRAVATRIDRLPEPVGFESLAEIADQAATITADGVDDLESVAPPAAVGAEVGELVVGIDAQGDLYAELATAAAAADREAVEALGAQRETRGTELGRLAEETAVTCALVGAPGAGTPGPSFEPPPRLDPSTAEAATEIPGFGDDPDLDALARQCGAGDAESCDLLGLSGPSGSGYEDYGATCGGRSESLIDDPGTFCVDVYAEG